MEFDLDEIQLDVLRPLSAHRAPKTTWELFGRSTHKAHPHPPHTSSQRAVDSSSLHHDSTMQPSN